MEVYELGELRTVSNVLRDHKFEAADLLVGWLLIDSKLMRVAFTKRELERPTARALKNLEDLPVLEANPPTRERFVDLDEDNKKLKAQVAALESRGLWARLMNSRT